MIYFQPEFRNQQGEIMNVVDSDGKAIGYIAYMYNNNNHLYVMGQLDETGEKQNFVDIASRFVEGLKKSILGDDSELNLYLHVSGEMIDLQKSGEEQHS